MGRPATGRTPGRNIRVPDHIWEAAKARAEAESTTVSAEIIAFLRRYGKPYADAVSERVNPHSVSTESGPEVR